MPDWLAAANAWTAIPLAVVGFVVAIIQATRAVGKAEAARIAANAASDKINSNLILVLLPQLTQLEANLEWAIRWALDHGDKNPLIHYLGAWRWQASQARGHLDEKKDETMMSRLQTSIAIAADTKIALQEPTADVMKRTRGMMQAVAEVTGSIGEITAKNAMKGTK